MSNRAKARAKVRKRARRASFGGCGEGENLILSLMTRRTKREARGEKIGFLIEVRNLIRTRTDWSASSPLKSRNRSFLDVSSPSAGVTFLSEGCCRSERRVYVMWRRMVFSVAFHKRSGGRRCQSRGKWQTFETMALSIKQGGICELER